MPTKKKQSRFKAVTPAFRLCMKISGDAFSSSIFVWEELIQPDGTRKIEPTLRKTASRSHIICPAPILEEILDALEDDGKSVVLYHRLDPAAREWWAYLATDPDERRLLSDPDKAVNAALKLWLREAGISVK